MAYSNKTYVAFDGDNDMWAYAYMKGWKQNENINFNFYNAHDLNTARDSSKEESIKVQLKKRMDESKVFVLLVGESTRYLYKFVKWEIDNALKLELPIIVVNLNNKKEIDKILCPPVLKDKLAMHIPFGAKIMQYTMENWPYYHKIHISQGKEGPFSWKSSVYEGLFI